MIFKKKDPKITPLDEVQDTLFEESNKDLKAIKDKLAENRLECIRESSKTIDSIIKKIKDTLKAQKVLSDQRDAFISKSSIDLLEIYEKARENIITIIGGGAVQPKKTKTKTKIVEGRKLILDHPDFVPTRENSRPAKPEDVDRFEDIDIQDTSKPKAKSKPKKVAKAKAPVKQEEEIDIFKESETVVDKALDKAEVTDIFAEEAKAPKSKPAPVKDNTVGVPELSFEAITDDIKEDSDETSKLLDSLANKSGEELI